MWVESDGLRAGKPLTDHKAAVLKRWPEAWCVRGADGRYRVLTYTYTRYDLPEYTKCLGSGPTEEAAWKNAAEGE